MSVDYKDDFFSASTCSKLSVNQTNEHKKHQLQEENVINYAQFTNMKITFFMRLDAFNIRSSQIGYLHYSMLISSNKRWSGVALFVSYCPND